MSPRHILWNLFGLGLPLVIAALTIPKLLAIIGQERFGFLALAWGLIGYAGALDLGIGRAVTQKISALRGSDADNEIPNVLATAVRLTFFTGVLGMGVIILAALLGAYLFIKSSSVPALELKNAMLLLGLALPLQAMSATYRGVNEAYLNFRSISLLRVGLGVANFLGPFLIALYSSQIDYLVASLVVSRGLALWFYRKNAYQCIGDVVACLKAKYSNEVAKQLLQFGGWFTVTSVVGPLMVQSDRFFVGALISTASITVYVIPYEVVVQALIVVGAITSVAFPAISRLLILNPVSAKVLFRKWLIRVGLMMTIGMGFLAYILPDILYLWLGRTIEYESIIVGRILTLGVAFNAIGSMYFALLHAKGYSKHTAILHLFETPLYFFLLIALITQYGVTGCAIAWSIRNVFDTFLLIWMGQKFVLDR